MPNLFIVDSLTVDGVALPIEDSSVMLAGALGFENESVASASGVHGSKRKRIVPTIKGKLMFTRAVSVDELKAICNAQAVLRQAEDCSGQPRRVRCGGVEIAKLGEIGGGSVDVEFNVLGRIEWL